MALSVNGITAGNKVNVHKAKDVGQAIIESMVGFGLVCVV